MLQIQTVQEVYNYLQLLHSKISVELRNCKNILKITINTTIDDEPGETRNTQETIKLGTLHTMATEIRQSDKVGCSFTF